MFSTINRTFLQNERVPIKLVITYRDRARPTRYTLRARPHKSSLIERDYNRRLTEVK